MGGGNQTDDDEDQL